MERRNVLIGIGIEDTWMITTPRFNEGWPMLIHTRTEELEGATVEEQKVE